MILSNVELHHALDDGRNIIAPEPFPRTPSVNEPDCPYDTHSVDLTLSEQLSVPKSHPHAIDLREDAPQGWSKYIADHSDPYTLSEMQPHKLSPYQLVLGRTHERIALPIFAEGISLAARIEGKSSRARWGLLVHCTAPTNHPGFEGTITLEIINLGPIPILLTPRMRIAQLIVEQVLGTPIPNPSQFQGQDTPSGLNRPAS